MTARWMRWRRRRRALAAAALGLGLVAGAGGPAPAHAGGDFGPDTCLEGFVWREAVPGDRVCVTGAVRAQAAFDTSQAAVRRSPIGGPYGPDTCRWGYVWREAVPGDHVCVTGDVRAQARADNARASERRNSLRVWHTTYTIPPRCDGDICTSTSTDSIPRFRLHADHVNVGSVVVELRRSDDDALRRRWTVHAPPAVFRPGGRLTLRTGVFDCARAADSYFRIRDPSSTRWSARHDVSSICSVL